MKIITYLITFSLALIIIITLKITDANTDNLETITSEYLVKVHITGVSEGETLTYFTEVGTATKVKGTTIPIKAKKGYHTICVTSSTGKWGGAYFTTGESNYVKDIYVNISIFNQPCTENKNKWHEN